MISFHLKIVFLCLLSKLEFNVSSINAVSHASWDCHNSMENVDVLVLAGNQSRYVQTTNALTSSVCGSSNLSSSLQTLFCWCESCLYTCRTGNELLSSDQFLYQFGSLSLGYIGLYLFTTHYMHG